MKNIIALMVLLANFRVAAKLPSDFVDINAYLPDAEFDIRYFGHNNFVGEPIEGYAAPKCLLQRQAAQALARVAVQADSQGYRLKVFDCYRPQRAVSHFMRWAADLEDTSTKAQYYPNLDKNLLVGEYIAEQSGHSRGATVDLSLMKQDESGQWHELDMGSDFDVFDPVSNTEHPGLTCQQKSNRQLLKSLMEAQGFSNYPMEWWHYSLQPQPYPDTYFDFVVQ